METQPRTALVLVDVIGAFYDPRGGMFCPDAPGTLAPIGRLLAAARASGALVVHAREQHAAGEPNWERIKLPEHLIVDTPETAWVPGTEPRPGELVIPKRRYSAFFGTDLAIRLYEHEVRRLVIAGSKTNVCVRATAQDAFAHGFAVLVPRDAVTSNRPHLHAAALEDLDRYFGSVVDLATAARMLGEAPPDSAAAGSAAPLAVPSAGATA